MWTKFRISEGGLLLIAVCLVVGGIVHANGTATTTASTTVNPGTLTTAILQNDGTTAVTTPAISMGAITSKTACQTDGISGTLGSDTQRVYVDNPDAVTSSTWTLDLAPSSPTALWSDGGSNKMDFNDPSGCTDNASDTDTYGGQMSVDPSIGGGATITADCASTFTCTTTGLSQGVKASYSEGTNDVINLITAASSADDIWRGYLKGVVIKQTIPAGIPAGAYSINLTLTATAQ